MDAVGELVGFDTGETLLELELVRENRTAPVTAFDGTIRLNC
jgi:hypothetical protein